MKIRYMTNKSINVKRKENSTPCARFEPALSRLQFNILLTSHLMHTYTVRQKLSTT